MILKTDTAVFNIALRSICGKSHDTVFLCAKDPNKIYLTKKDFSPIGTISIDLPQMGKMFPEIYPAIKYPSIFILGGNTKSIISGNIAKDSFKIRSIQSNNFDNVVTISDRTSFFRSFDQNGFKSRFFKVDLESLTIRGEDTHFSDAVNSMIIYDGQLNYDEIKNRLSYVCFYCNRVVCFDTLFHLIYEGHTIDTTLIPTVHPVVRQKSITHGAPPRLVNGESCAYNGEIFVQSALKADNETDVNFNRNLVIDFYDEDNGLYKGSFYIPRFKGEKLNRISFIEKGELCAIYGKHVLKFLLKQ
jgi:hypothetical protein